MLVALLVLASSVVGIGVFVAYSSLYISSEGTVRTEAFDSEALNHTTMQYEIYLPPGYDDIWHMFTRYPVIYLLPASPGLLSLSYSGIAGQMDTLIAQGKVQPMILVAPQETLTPHMKNSNGGYVDGPLGNWATYTTQDLVNEIDFNYKTIQFKDGRAVAGHSEGGYGAMNLGLKNPSEFGVIGSFSGYFTIDEKDLSRIFGGDQSLAEANSPMLYLPQLEEELSAIHFIVGQDDKHWLEENVKFAEELKARDAHFEFNIVPGAHQTEDPWSDFFVFAGEHLAGRG